MIAAASFFIIKPFLTPVLGSFVAAYLFYPVYLRLNKRIKNKSAAALFVSLLLILLFAIPFVFFVNSAISEASVFYVIAKQQIVTGKILDCGGVSCIPEFLQSTVNHPQFKFYMEQGISKMTNAVIEAASNFLLSLPFLFLNIFITLIITFFLLRDGHRLIAWLKKVTPFDKKFQKDIFRQLENVTSAVIHGQFLMALLIGFLGGLIFFILGLTSPVLWGVIMAILSFLPVIGAPLVWFPTALILIISGVVSKNLILLWKGIALMLFGGILMTGLIENVVKPRLVGKKANVHPVVILLGLLGGISVFGLIGVVMGPIILALFITFLDVYERDVI